MIKGKKVLATSPSFCIRLNGGLRSEHGEFDCRPNAGKIRSSSYLLVDTGRAESEGTSRELFLFFFLLIY